MSSSTTSGQGNIHKKSEKCKSNKKKLFTSPSTYNNNPHPPPPSSCGPPILFENEFIKFYAELYKSAILFSNQNYQQMLLFSHYDSTLFKHQNQSKCQSYTDSKRTIKKGHRRLSSGGGGGGVQLKKTSSSTSNYNSAESGDSLTKESFSNHFLHVTDNTTIDPTPNTSTPLIAVANKAAPTSSFDKVGKLKRKVSFSKHSPSARSRSNSTTSKQQSQHVSGTITTSMATTKTHRGGDHVVPWITIHETCWSSDLDESDTTETDENATATSTLGEEEDCYFMKKNGGGGGDGEASAGGGDGDNENSTDDGKIRKNKTKGKTNKMLQEKTRNEELEVELKFSELSTTNEKGDKEQRKMSESEA